MSRPQSVRRHLHKLSDFGLGVLILLALLLILAAITGVAYFVVTGLRGVVNPEVGGAILGFVVLAYVVGRLVGRSRRRKAAGGSMSQYYGYGQRTHSNENEAHTKRVRAKRGAA